MQTNLASLGFHRIGSTNYFKQGGFIIENGDLLVVWSDINAEADITSTFVAVTRWSISLSSPLNIGIIRKQANGRLRWVSSSFNGSSSMDYSGSQDVLHLSHRKQVEVAGFSPLVGDVIYSCTGENGYEYLIALEKDHIIGVAIKATLPSITEILAYTSRFNTQFTQEECLDVLTDQGHFEIKNSGVGIKSINKKQ